MRICTWKDEEEEITKIETTFWNIQRTLSKTFCNVQTHVASLNIIVEYKDATTIFESC